MVLFWSFYGRKNWCANIFLGWFKQAPFNWGMYMRNAFFVENVGMTHAWYMPVILGMYIFLPYVSRALHSISNKALIVIMAIMFVIFR